MRQLFLDCDGVLADFDTLGEQIFGVHPHKAEESLGGEEFWKTLRTYEDFFYNLPLMPEAAALVMAFEHLSPVILTGVPKGGWAEAQKVRWGQKHFPHLDMITCLSHDKRNHMNPGDVLVDDMHKYQHLWEEAGGHFILYRPGGAEDVIRRVLELFEEDQK
ncbi:hypothetical protein [Terracidiphilus sp.]|jgi:hypothetical protein|uniref:hypothetical protein n=1 Tax=Terracidiphilus sp. TaxID=1964191 RepID=UPI003C1C6DD2